MPETQMIKAPSPPSPHAAKDPSPADPLRQTMVVSSLLRPLASAVARPPLCAACSRLLLRDVTTRQLLLRDVTTPRDVIIRQLSGGGGGGGQDRNRRLRSTLYYVTAMGVLVGGLSYAAVPLYRIFCQVCMMGP